MEINNNYLCIIGCTSTCIAYLLGLYIGFKKGKDEK